MSIIQEQEYDFLLNKSNELMLVFYGQELPPKDPTLDIYADYVILVRSLDGIHIRMDEIPAEIWKALRKVKKVLVCEIDGDGDFRHVYDAKVVTKK